MSMALKAGKAAGKALLSREELAARELYENLIEGRDGLVEGMEELD